MEKWILDTDIGSDSDDAMALGFVLAHKEIDLLGVTTVSGNSKKRAQFAKIMCDLSNCSTPVYYGNETSVQGDIKQGELVPWVLEAMQKYPVSEVKSDAVLFMKETIEKNPGEIVLTAIGQFTNIAILFSAFPHIPKMLKALVLMGGRFFDNDVCDINVWGYTEWNIKCDPFAAAMVFHNENVCECYISGVEETCRCRYVKNIAEITKKVKDIPYMKPVLESWKSIDGKECVSFHDAIAIWAYLNRDKVKWHKGNVLVDVKDCDTTTTTLKPTVGGNHNLLYDLDLEEFFADYAKTLGFTWSK